MADEEERKGWGGLTGYFFNLLVQASFHDEDLLVEDRLLPEVVHWSGSGAAGIGEPLVDLSLLVRLARSSAEHQRVVRYLVAMLALVKVGGVGRESVWESVVGRGSCKRRGQISSKIWGPFKAAYSELRYCFFHVCNSA